LKRFLEINIATYVSVAEQGGKCVNSFPTQKNHGVSNNVMFFILLASGRVLVVDANDQMIEMQNDEV
jgi:hypothetical protein